MLRAATVGFNPVWRRLDVPEQINLKHFRDADGNKLPANRTVPLATDCLWGMDWAGQVSSYPCAAGQGTATRAR